jgi:hypothetical protein
MMRVKWYALESAASYRQHGRTENSRAMYEFRTRRAAETFTVEQMARRHWSGAHILRWNGDYTERAHLGQ